MEEIICKCSQKIQNSFEKWRTGGFWVFKSFMEVCVFLSLWMIFREKIFLGVGDEAQNVVKKHVWFKSWTLEWFE